MAKLTGNFAGSTTRSIQFTTGFVPAGETLEIPDNDQLVVGELVVDGSIEFGENSSIYPL